MRCFNRLLSIAPGRLAGRWLTAHHVLPPAPTTVAFAHTFTTDTHSHTQDIPEYMPLSMYLTGVRLAAALTRGSVYKCD
jgi:hypothetical protein